MEQNRLPKQGEIYRHIKDKPFQVIAVATHAETKEQMVVYQELYGDFQIYVHPLSSFFNEVNHQKNSDTVQTNQSVRLDKASVQTNEDLTADGEINSLLMRFLDAETYSKKLEIVTSNRKHMSDRLINDMAVAIDCTVEEGPLEDRLQALINCLQQMSRFENKRLR